MHVGLWEKAAVMDECEKFPALYTHTGGIILKIQRMATLSKKSMCFLKVAVKKEISLWTNRLAGG